MIINYKNKKINIPVKKVSGLGKATGLMFKKNTTNNLLFEFKKETRMKIHSYFVFFDFLALWIDSNGKTSEWKIIKPFTLRAGPEKPFTKLIEIPINKKNKKIVEFFVDRGKI